MGAALGVMIGRTVTWHGRNFYASPMLLPHGGTGCHGRHSNQQVDHSRLAAGGLSSIERHTIDACTACGTFVGNWRCCPCRSLCDPRVVGGNRVRRLVAIRTALRVLPRPVSRGHPGSRRRAGRRWAGRERRGRDGARPAWHAGPTLRLESLTSEGIRDRARHTRPLPQRSLPALSLDGPLDPDAYHLKFVRVGDVRYLVVTGDTDRGVLYGAFALLRKIALGQPLPTSTSSRALRADPLGEPVGQPRRHDRARLRRAVDLLGERPRPRGSARGSATTPACWRRSASTASPSTTSTPTPACSPRSRCRRSPASPRRFGPGACASRSPSTSAARRRSAASTPSIRSTRR